jgi:hypothetical protein
VRSINGEAMHDKIAREGKKIGFNIDKNWPGINGAMAIKVSVFDDNAGTLNLKYSNGTEIVTLSKPLLGDQLLRTYTFFVSNFKIGGKIGGAFDFTLEAGDATSKLVVSFVRVIQSDELLSTDKVGSLKGNTISIYPNPVSTILNIDFTDGEKNKEIQLYNMLGQLVYSLKTTNSSTQIDMKSLNLKGVVLVKVIGEEGISTQKIVVD